MSNLALPPVAGQPRGRYNQRLGPEQEKRMAIERTLSIVKPDATRRNLTGAINDRFERRGLRIIAQKRIQLSPAQAGAFYEVHSSENAAQEIAFFFSAIEICP